MSQRISGGNSNENDSDTSSWIARAREVLPDCSLRTHDPQFANVFVRGQGSYLWDAQGNRWLDMISGYSASNLGHADPRLVNAANEASGQFSHLTGDLHPEKIQLAETLLGRFWHSETPGAVVFNSGGARAIETAIKAATSFRPGKILTFSPSFHGRSIATSALSATASCNLSHLFSPQVVTWDFEDFPYCEQCSGTDQTIGADRSTRAQLCLSCNAKLESLLNYISRESNELSCLVIDPAITARGYLLPRAIVGKSLANVAQQHGVIVIADEIQSGLGRCGSWLLSSSQGWQADLVVLGKSLGGGIVPISAVIGARSILDAIPSGAESETFAATPIACRIAQATLSCLADGVFQRGEHTGAIIRNELSRQLQSLGHSDSLQIKITGQGAVCAVNFGPNGQSLASEYVASCSKNFIRVQLSGPQKSRVVLLPPLNMTDDELADASSRLRNVSTSLVPIGQ